MRNRVRFDFLGFTLEIEGDSSEAVWNAERDYAYFRVPVEAAAADALVELREEAPPYAQLPALPAAFFTPRNVCYQNEGLTYVDYFGKGLAVHDRCTHRCVVYAEDADLLREIAYYYILSTVGEALDQSGLHRAHALGVTYAGQGLLLLLPSGGGKSTMALELLRQPGFGLLAEDTPLIDRTGRLRPFPLRLGVRPGGAVGIPEQFVRTVTRMEFDPKTLIDVEYFREQLPLPGAVVDPAYVLVGQRNLGAVSEIVPISRLRLFQALLKYVIVGLGVYQGLEFLLEHGTGDTLRLGATAFSRLGNCLQLMQRAPGYCFVMGRDRAANTETLLRFVRERLGEPMEAPSSPSVTR